MSRIQKIEIENVGTQNLVFVEKPFPGTIPTRELLGTISNGPSLFNWSMDKTGGGKNSFNEALAEMIRRA